MILILGMLLVSMVLGNLLALAIKPKTISIWIRLPLSCVYAVVAFGLAVSATKNIPAPNELVGAVLSAIALFIFSSGKYMKKT